MDGSKRRWLGRALGLAVAALLAWGPPQAPARAQAPAQGGDVVVFAAASLKNALDAVNAQWQKETGKKAAISYAASSALAKQIEQGAPAQMFISADLDWMDYRRAEEPDQARHALQPARQPHRADRAQGQGAGRSTSSRASTSPRSLGDGRLAMANVDAVPAGKYGKAALEKLGVWASVSGKVAQAENVRAALLLVSRGEAPVGIVYQTDAAADPNVKIIGTFPEDTHPADRLSDRADGQCQPIPTRPRSSPTSSRRRQGRCSRRRGSRC